MINKLNDFEKNMLLMAGSAAVGMMYSYMLYENTTNDAFGVASILGLFFIGAFILSISIRAAVWRNQNKPLDRADRSENMKQSVSGKTNSSKSASKSKDRTNKKLKK